MGWEERGECGSWHLGIPDGERGPFPFVITLRLSILINPSVIKIAAVEHHIVFRSLLLPHPLTLYVNQTI